jgi:protein involved in polysaccharide export with SLBB domain
MVVVRSLLCASLVLASLGCNRSGSSARPSTADVDSESEDTIGNGDVFEVRVLGQPDISGRYKVGNEGTIQFPFLGAMEASGKEPGQLAQDIAKGLRDGNYLRDPQVSVLIEQSNSKRLSVLGAVTKPGTFPIIPGMTVIQAISQAGGFTGLADKDNTVVTRRVDGKLERYRVPVSEIARGTTEDIPLRANDIVFVPERIF